MEMLLSLVVILFFMGGLYILSWLKRSKRKSFNFRVLTGLAGGLIFGGIIQFLFTSDVAITDNVIIQNLLTFMSIFGNGYVRLLEMIVIPLILVAMTTSIMHSTEEGAIKKIAPKVIGMLVGTVMIAALIGITVIQLSPVDGNELMTIAESGDTTAYEDKQEYVMEKQETLSDSNYAEFIVNIIPKNIFYMMSGQNSTDTLSAVVFAMFLGYAILQIRKRKPDKVEAVINLIDATKEVVLSMVREILKLTPFAIFAIISSFAVTSTPQSILTMFSFIGASYVAIILMYLVHLVIIMIAGLNPKTFVKKTWPVLSFGFGSRSSMAALPLNISAQTENLGVDDATASMAATFGTSIGQNGCAGIYPAMVAVMATQIAGIEPTFGFYAMLVIVVAISSFGIAGVGGGATFAAVAVLSIMGLDIKVVAILVSIEPLIDMARTALNISDSMVAGVVTAKLNKTLDIDKYNA